MVLNAAIKRSCYAFRLNSPHWSYRKNRAKYVNWDDKTFSPHYILSAEMIIFESSCKAERMSESYDLRLIVLIMSFTVSHEEEFQLKVGRKRDFYSMSELILG